MQLRPYQEEGLQALWSYFMTKKGNPVLAWPTGTGKSLVPAEFIRRTMYHYPDQRFLMLTHVSKLIEQNYQKMLELWPQAPIGIYSAELNSRDIVQPIIYGGIQSMIKIAEAFGYRDIIFIDEAHLVSMNESSMYQRFIAILKRINPRLKIIGMSATPYRIGQGMITDDGLFTDIAHDLTSLENFNQLVYDGYISPLVPKKTQVELDVSNVGTQKGEFITSQLQHEVDKAEITWKAMQELCYYGQNRRSWLIYATGIEHSDHIAEMLGKLGIECASVHSKQSKEYNRQALEAHKNLKLKAIVSYSKLTTGLDHPAVDLIGCLRPTLSVALWVQMLGRGTRPVFAPGFDLQGFNSRWDAIRYGGKQNCIAEGSLVLTDNGLIPIEKISVYDKIWDGENFVFHDGIIYKGYKEVIEYDGLMATVDHKVWTKKGWQTFGKCFEEKIGIAVTGNGRNAIQLSENHFSRNTISQTLLHSSSMYHMRKNLLQRFYKCYKWKSWLQKVWQFKWRFAKMVNQALFCSKTTMHKSEKQSLSRLWWAWNKIQFQFSSSNGSLGKEQFGLTSTSKHRSEKQQWSLRNWKFKVFNKFGKHEKPKISKKHVFDIANAGRHNRFTVNGRLVSNCLVLDFARNTTRLGPINDPVIPKKKGDKEGTIPIKLCEGCGTYHHIKATHCDQCGKPFEFKVKIVEKAATDELIANYEAPKIEFYDINYITYNKHSKVNKPPSLKVTYFNGLNGFSEYICLEHKGLALHNAHNWWRQRTTIEPPTSIEDALKLTSKLRQPRRIRVHLNRKINGRKYPEILSHEFGE